MGDRHCLFTKVQLIAKPAERPHTSMLSNRDTDSMSLSGVAITAVPSTCLCQALALDPKRHGAYTKGRKLRVGAEFAADWHLMELQGLCCGACITQTRLPLAFIEHGVSAV